MTEKKMEQEISEEDLEAAAQAHWNNEHYVAGAWPPRNPRNETIALSSMRLAITALISRGWRQRSVVLDWQPIATAPKLAAASFKTIYLLGWCPQDPNDPDAELYEARVIWWEPKLKGGCWYGDGDHQVKPTHWMFLPAGPAP